MTKMNDSERLDAVIKNRWIVGNDPSGYFKRFIVGRTGLNWPACVVADGDTARDAIDAAISVENSTAS